MAYYDGVLYISNNSEVYLLQCKMDLKSGEVKKRKLEKSQIHKIVPGVPIHGMFNVKIQVNKFYWRTPVVIAMET